MKQVDITARLKLIKTMGALNRKYGSQTLRPVQTMQKPCCSIGFNYPVMG
jgi:hypothetical protein